MNNILQEISCLLEYPWKSERYIGNDRGLIIGQWSEDGSCYEIIVPEQLIKPIITMQNWLHLKYKYMNNLKDKVRNINYWFEAENKQIEID